MTPTSKERAVLSAAFKESEISWSADDDSSIASKLNKLSGLSLSTNAAGPLSAKTHSLGKILKPNCVVLLGQVSPGLKKHFLIVSPSIQILDLGKFIVGLMIDHICLEPFPQLTLRCMSA